jgi:actin-related protein
MKYLLHFYSDLVCSFVFLYTCFFIFLKLSKMMEFLSLFMQVKLVTALAAEKSHAAWIGGSILGICGSFQQLWLTKADYEELGAQRAARHFNR